MINEGGVGLRIVGEEDGGSGRFGAGGKLEALTVIVGLE